MISVRTIESEVEVYSVVEELGVQTEFPRLSVLRLHIVERSRVRFLPLVGLVVVCVARVREEATECRCHLRVRSTHLEEVDALRHLHHVRSHSRHTYRRVEER